MSNKKTTTTTNDVNNHNNFKLILMEQVWKVLILPHPLSQCGEYWCGRGRAFRNAVHVIQFQSKSTTLIHITKHHKKSHSCERMSGQEMLLGFKGRSMREKCQLTFFPGLAFHRHLSKNLALNTISTSHINKRTSLLLLLSVASHTFSAPTRSPLAVEKKERRQKI